jgi:uncharacterized protein (DUF1684 family)
MSDCKIFLAITLIAGVALAGCSKSEISKRELLTPEKIIARERSEKDAAFRSGANSPILPGEKKTFKGLSYYPINAGLRFSARLHRYPSPRQIRMATNTGEIRSGLQYGYFEFRAEGRDCRLQVYRLEDAPDTGGGASLFVAFRDATSGVETYGAGRYIDLKENTSGVYDLDFNRAYNPYCAYNTQFSCPVPPADNTLKVPIRAGEKRYH